MLNGGRYIDVPTAIAFETAWRYPHPTSTGAIA
jgi:hypothetical protein